MSADGAGTFVAVVGPSGAGKDTLLDAARTLLAEEVADGRILFVRRVVTRASDASAEDHDTMDLDSFARAQATGAFAVTWEAHGLSYGLPASVLDTVAAGGVAVANVSRAIIGDLRDRFGRVLVINVTAPAEVLEKRLAARGRETADDIERRLQRSRAEMRTPENALTICNGGTVAEAAAKLADALGEALARTHAAA